MLSALHMFGLKKYEMVNINTNMHIEMYTCILSTPKKKKRCIYACMRKTSKPHVCVCVKLQTKQIKELEIYSIFNGP